MSLAPSLKLANLGNKFTVNFFLPYLRLTVKIFNFYGYRLNFLAVLRLSVNPIKTLCCMLLDVVAQSLKPVKLFSQQLPTFLLFRDRRSVAQQCWICLILVYKGLWVAPFPRCAAGPNIVRSCCVHLYTTANTDERSPNIVGATMLGVVASVCTQP